MIDIESWLTSQKTIEKSKRYYAHFDYRTDMSKCKEYVSNPRNIATHSFYPFVHYTKDMSKFSFEKKGLKEKHRDICYAAHIDRCIFQYYNFLLNELYNNECDKLGIGDVAIAYRTNLRHQSNIDFAKKAIQFIRDSGNCYIMIGDFTKFFDNLDHNYLKRQWCNLLGVPKLPADHYAVFKNITHFSYIELTDLLELHNLEDSSSGCRELNAKKRLLSPVELREKKDLIKKNREYGIPQGSPISGILANIYAIEIDKRLHDFVSEFNGMYMRYSDDFIVVLPNIDESSAIEKLKTINGFFDSADCPGIELQPNKTQYYSFSQNHLANCGLKVNEEADCSNQHLNFLGFTFDGNKVNLRAKTVSKYYQRMRRKSKTIAKSENYTKTGKHISKRNLYERYSIRGAESKKGNFLTYANRALDKFGADELISLIPERNMSKVRSFLKKDYTNNTKNKKGTTEL